MNAPEETWTRRLGRAAKWPFKMALRLWWRFTVWIARVSLAVALWFFGPRSWFRRLQGIVNRLRMRSVSLRRWQALALGALILLPLTATGIVIAISVVTMHDSDISVDELLTSGADRWSDPAWHEQLGSELDAHDIDIVLYQDGVEIYRSTPVPEPEPGPGPEEGAVRQFIVPGEGPERMALIYGDGLPWDEEGNEPWLVPVAFLGTLALTVVGISMFFGRSVVKPLAATSAAAGEVAGGNLDITLPSSRVREVAQVNEAFMGMSKALQESLQHEAALERERRLFIGAIAHDLRTPLFTLRGSLEAMETGVADTPEKQAKYLSIAQDKADTLERLISDLFDFTRLEYLEQTPDWERFDLGALLRRLVEGFQPRASAKGLELVLDDRLASSVVSGDPHLLTRAIENLLDNAIRYTPSGGQVRVECLQDHRSAVFSVIDTGPGIPPADLPHLFDPLFRGEESRNRRTGGAGLGLTIAHRILIAHGGELTARNGTPHGAIFTGTLPRANDEPRPHL